MALLRTARLHRRKLALGAILVLVAAGLLARSALGIEWNAASVREVVNGFGLWGPVILVLMLSFRQVLLIPSQILLIGGGLCFGALPGTLYGALGITLSGILVFSLTRSVGEDLVRSHIPEQLRSALRAASGRAGSLAVLVGTGYPVGPVTAFHAGAALTGMAFLAFLFAVIAGALVRAATFTYFGSTLVEGDAKQLILAVALVAVVALLPALHPRTRGWLRHQLRSRATASRSSAEKEPTAPE